MGEVERGVALPGLYPPNERDQGALRGGPRRRRMSGALDPEDWEAFRALAIARSTTWSTGGAAWASGRCGGRSRLR